MSLSQVLIQLIVGQQNQQTASQINELSNRSLSEILPPVIDLLQDAKVIQNPPTLMKILIFMKNCLTAKDPEKASNKKAQWNTFTIDIKNGIHGVLFNLLNSADSQVHSVLSEVIAIVASYDIPLSQWSDLIEVLTNDSFPITIQKVCLNICSLLFEKIDEYKMTVYLSKILPRFVTDINNEHLYEIRLNGIKNLLNHYRSFSFNNFDVLFDIVVDSTKTNISENALTIRLETLSIVVENLYEKLIGQNDRLCNFLINTVEKYGSSEDIVKKVYDVWCTIGRVESDTVKTRKSQNILITSISKLYPQIVRVINGFAKEVVQEDDDEGEDQNSVIYVSQEIVTYMTMVAHDPFSSNVLNSITQSLNGNQLSQQYISLMLFGAILEGGCSLKNLIVQNIPSIVQIYSNSQNGLIKMAASKALIKVLKMMPQLLNGQIINQLITTALNIISSNNKSYIISSCLLIGYIYKTVEEGNSLSSSVNQVHSTLIKLVQMNDELIQRTSLQSLKRIVGNLYKVNAKPLILNTFNSIIQFIQLLQQQGNMKAISICIQIMGDCIDELTEEIQSNPNTINLQQTMNILISYLANTDTFDSAMKAIVTVSSVLAEQFQVFTGPVVEKLLIALKEVSQSEMIKESCITIEQLSLAIKTAMSPYVEQLLTQLFNDLQSNQLNFKVKFTIIKAISGLAVGIGFNGFSRYTSVILNALGQITKNLLGLKLDLYNEDGAEFFESMMESILICYSRLYKGSDQTIINFIDVPINLTLSIHQVICSGSGYVNTDIIYSAVCAFYDTIVSLPFICQSQELFKKIFTPSVLEVIRSCDSNTEEEDLRINVDSLVNKLKKLGVFQ
ncbi:hypothetical protein ENUP19_0086G0008 [Entamoeba nuttalli]|uniref:Importin beta, putative n=2 Tax=Entamoeba nuttalli TaxID=412467 RepID=K2GCD2_ENTNP|nr:importin beta, putative [Entamoeba nuttalli P19]EKE40181.1 importin beta, putative [Entamoeba nuttalli P19]|eukprot:XP_008857482.1 importin beta, putative [Entamoeba nuttalli P19]